MRQQHSLALTHSLLLVACLLLQLALVGMPTFTA